MPWFEGEPFETDRLLVVDNDLDQKKTINKMVTTLITNSGNAALLSIKVICLGFKYFAHLNIQIFIHAATRT